jgi:hypothetical protein
VAVDAFTANAIVQILDKLSPQNKAKYLAMSIRQMVDVAYKLMSK